MRGSGLRGGKWVSEETVASEEASGSRRRQWACEAVKDLIVQYQAKYEKDVECGGRYLKTGPKPDDLKTFGYSTPKVVNRNSNTGHPVLK